MKKTISINLSGLIFYVEEDGYEALKGYLESIRAQFSNDDEADMVMEDVELRIAEIFSENANGGPITKDIVDLVMTMMGEASDYAPTDEDEQDYNSASNEKTVYVRNGLYRDPDNGYIGGVCEGLGHYFRIDKNLVRALLVIFVLLGGSGILLYIILWAAIPKAKSTSDRLRMKGVEVTVENISKEVHRAGESLTKKSKEFSHKIKKETTDGVRTLSNAFLKIVGAFFLLGAFLALTAFTVLTLGGIGIVGSDSGGNLLNLFQLSEIFFASTLVNTLAWTTVYAGVLSFIILLALFGVKLIWNPMVKGIKYLSLSLVALIFIAVISSFSIGISTGLDFSAEAESKIELAAIKTDTLEIHYISNYPLNINSSAFRSSRDELFRIEDELISSKFEDLDFHTSEDSLTRIYNRRVASGSTSMRAHERLSNLKHDIKQEGNKLYVQMNYNFPIEDKFRGQESEIDIYVPEHVTIKSFINGEMYEGRHSFRSHNGIYIHSEDYNGRHEININF